MRHDGLRSLAQSEQGLCTRGHGYVGLFSSNGKRLVHRFFFVRATICMESMAHNFHSIGELAFNFTLISKYTPPRRRVRCTSGHTDRNVV